MEFLIIEWWGRTVRCCVAEIPARGWRGAGGCSRIRKWCWSCDGVNNGALDGIHYGPRTTRISANFCGNDDGPQMARINADLRGFIVRWSLDGRMDEVGCLSECLKIPMSRGYFYTYGFFTIPSILVPLLVILILINQLRIRRSETFYHWNQITDDDTE